MKKALIITFGPHHGVGGIETYNRFLIKLLIKKGFWVEEFVIDTNNTSELNKIEFDKTKFSQNFIKSFDKKIRKDGTFLWILKIWRSFKYSSKKLAEKINKENYNLIIDSRFWHHKLNAKSQYIFQDNYIFIQHWGVSFYDHFNSPIGTRWIFKTFYFLNKRKITLIYNARNVALFDKNNYLTLNEKKIKKDSKYYFLPISRYKSSEIKLQEMNWNERKIDFLYVGRLVQDQKNINFFLKGSEYLDTKISVVGHGPLEEKIKTFKNIDFLGAKKSDDLIDIYKNSKYIILTSFFEGFPVVLVEAISHGVIPIILDTYPSAKFLSTHGYLLDKNINVKDWASKLNQIIKEDNSDLSKKNISFAKKYLSLENFEKNWSDIIDKISKK